ncbi:hypothetical protein [Persephonella sp.]
MKFSKQYTVYFASVVTASLLFAVYFYLAEYTSRLEEEKLNLKRQLIQLNIEEKKFYRLKKLVEKNNIKLVDEKTALQILLEKADRLLSIYDGKVLEGLKKENNSYSILISFEYYPEDSSDLYSFLQEIENSYMPVMQITEFELRFTEKGTKALLTIRLIQPFVGDTDG